MELKNKKICMCGGGGGGGVMQMSQDSAPSCDRFICHGEYKRIVASKIIMRVTNLASALSVKRCGFT